MSTCAVTALCVFLLLCVRGVSLLQFPLSPFQAFCIVLSALDGKVADSKSFQVLKSVATAVAGYAPAEKDDSD